MYFRRARRYALCALLIYVCICWMTLSWITASKTRSINPSSGRLKRIVDNVLDKEISDILAMTPRSSQAGLKRIQDLQNSLLYSISKGRWIMNPHSGYQWPSFLPGLASSKVHSDANRTVKFIPSVEICGSLAGKRILFVGPETTFYLHSLWLATLEKHESRSLPCLGHEFCTFHHICRAPATSIQEDSLEELSGRKKKIPSKNILVASASSLLQYAFSTTLYTSKNQQDRAYIEPIVDEHTGIRVSNFYWLRRARKSDIVIMNRGPDPAPATTYASLNDGRGGNWTFASNICAQQNLLEDGSCSTNLETLLVNAALFVTANKFLPSLLQSLKNIREDGEITRAPLIWQGSWYLQPMCATASLPTSVPLLQDIWSSEDLTLVDPWSFYYNIQVYMHDRLLPKILPHYNITFVPLTIPAYVKSSHLRFPEKVPAISAKLVKDCLRQPWPTFGVDSLEVVFFSALRSILHRK